MRIYDNGIYRDMTQEEINALAQSQNLPTEPTPEERLSTVEDAIQDLILTIFGGSM